MGNRSNAGQNAAAAQNTTAGQNTPANTETGNPATPIDIEAIKASIIAGAMEAAKAEAAAIVAAAVKEAETIVSGAAPEQAPSVKASDHAYEKVPLHIPKDPMHKDDVFVAVNGKRFLVKRGVNVMVPRFVYEALRESGEQDIVAADTIQRLSEQSRIQQ